MKPTKNIELKILSDFIVKHQPNPKKINEFQSEINIIERWSVKRVFDLFKTKNLFINKDEYSLDCIKNRLEIIPKYSNYLNSLLDLFIDYNLIKTVSKNNFKAIFNDRKADSSPPILNSISSLSLSNFDFMKQVLDAFINVLSGRSSFLPIMFPDGKFDRIEEIYKKNEDAYYFNKLVSLIVYYIVTESNDKNKSLDLLELGAGIGSTTEQVVPYLTDENSPLSYLYTDISKAFLHYGKSEFEPYKFMDYKVLNLNEDVLEQGFSENSFDLIIATNVIHSTSNILYSLKNVKSLLRDGGFLIINEGVNKRTFSTIAYGLTDGWWGFNDSSLRIKGSPFLNLTTWKKLLSEVGFNEIISVNNLTRITEQVYQDVIVVRYYE